MVILSLRGRDDAVRNRAIEAAAVLAIGIFTTMTVGTYIHQLNSQGAAGPDPLGVFAKRALQWIHGQHEAQSPLAPNTVPALAPASTVSRQVSGPVSRGVSARLSSSDDARLVAIAKSLSSRLTSDDWVKMANLLESTKKPSEVSAQLAALLTSKLSTEDQRWIETHFQGAQAFDQEDVSLLEETLTQVRGTLTPDEQVLLKQELSQFGVNIHG